MPKYRVKAGDNLLGLADQYQLDPQKILEANLGVNKIYPGMDINMPSWGPFEKIGGSIGAAFGNVGDYFTRALGDIGGLLGGGQSFQPGTVMPQGYTERMMAELAPQPTLGPGPPQTETPPTASSYYNIAGRGRMVRQLFQTAAAGEGKWPSIVMASDIKLAYPGWTAEKTQQAMTAAGFVYDAKSGAYHQRGTGAGAGGARGEVSPYGEAGEIVMTGENAGYIRKYSSGRPADYGKSGQHWRVVTSGGMALTIPDTGYGTGHGGGISGTRELLSLIADLKAKGPLGEKGRRKLQHYEALLAGRQQEATQQPVSINSPGGSVGLVWRVGS